MILGLKLSDKNKNKKIYLIFNINIQMSSFASGFDSSINNRVRSVERHIGQYQLNTLYSVKSGTLNLFTDLYFLNNTGSAIVIGSPTYRFRIKYYDADEAIIDDGESSYFTLGSVVRNITVPSSNPASYGGYQYRIYVADVHNHVPENAVKWRLEFIVVGASDVAVGAAGATVMYQNIRAV